MRGSCLKIFKGPNTEEGFKEFSRSVKKKKMGTEDISKFNKSFLKMKWAFLKSSEFPVRGVR